MAAVPTLVGLDVGTTGVKALALSIDGTVLAWQPYGQEGLLVTDIDLTAATGLLASRCRTA